MSAPAPKGFWFRCRRFIRWCRITLLLAVLGVVGSLIYFHSVGVPLLLQNWLRAELRARGLDVEYSRLRLRWYRGLVADDLQIGQAGLKDNPVLMAREVAVRLDHEALKHFQFHVESLILHQGRCLIPIAPTGAAPEVFEINAIEAELRLLHDDQWELDPFQAECLGARLSISGTLANASAVRRWSKPSRAVEGARATAAWKAQLREFKSVAQKMQFRQPPELRLTVQGDALHPEQFRTRFSLHATGSSSPWVNADHLLVTVIGRPSSNTLATAQTDITINASNAKTPWGALKSGSLKLSAEQPLTNDLPADLRWELQLQQAKFEWGEAESVRATGHSNRDPANTNLLDSQINVALVQIRTSWASAPEATLAGRLTHTATNWIPSDGAVQLKVQEPASEWGNARSLVLTGTVARATESFSTNALSAWGPWAKFAPVQIAWSGSVEGYSSHEVQTEDLDLAGTWSPPSLHIKRLHSALYGGEVGLQGDLDVAQRRLEVRGASDFDLLKLTSLLNTNSQRWLEQFTWEAPPRIAGSASVTLPPWTNRPAGWKAELFSSLAAIGEFSANGGSYRGLAWSTAHSHLHFTNGILALPDLRVTRPEGQITVAFRSDTQSSNYVCELDTDLDPNLLRPLLDPKAHQAFDYFEFTSPPRLQGELVGRGFDPDSIGFRGSVEITNFTFRGEHLDQIKAGVTFSNLFITATNVIVSQGEQRGDVTLAAYDLRTQMVYLTNAISTLDPMLVGRAIGPKTAKAIAPYHFKNPPHVIANGSLHVHGDSHDLHFEVSGADFDWWKFNINPVTGGVHWVGDTLTISNLQAGFYRGELHSDLFFDFEKDQDDHGADFHFNAVVTDADLHALMSDLATSSNHLEGVVGAVITITNANTADWKSWQGSAHVQMRDGYLWDIPLFGVFSDVLNKISPGMGRARAGAATGSATIVNSVLHTRDLDIRTPVMHLAYAGSVDFGGNVTASVEAEMLRGMPVFGPVVRLVTTPLTKLFEYKVSGTLMHPKLETKYIPNFLWMPLHPYRTLKDWFGSGPADKPEPVPEPQPEKSK